MNIMKNNIIHARDIVKVSDWGKCYSGAIAWFKKNEAKLFSEWMVKYAYESYPLRYDNDDDDEYIVLYVDRDNDKALIQKKDHVEDFTYLIGCDGLITNRRKITIKEIEEILGYEIEIVD